MAEESFSSIVSNQSEGSIGLVSETEAQRLMRLSKGRMSSDSNFHSKPYQHKLLWLDFGISKMDSFSR